MDADGLGPVNPNEFSSQTHRGLNIKLGAVGIAIATASVGGWWLGHDNSPGTQSAMQNQGSRNEVDETPPSAEDVGYTEGEIGLDYPDRTGFYISVENDTSEVVYPTSDDPETLVKQLLANDENSANVDTVTEAAAYIDHYTDSEVLRNDRLEFAEEYGTTFHTDLIFNQIMDYDFSSSDVRRVTFIFTQNDNGVFANKYEQSWVLLPHEVTVNGNHFTEWLIHEASFKQLA